MNETHPHLIDLKPTDSLDASHIMAARRLDHDELYIQIADPVIVALYRWARWAQPPGGFLMAVLRGDLLGAATRADAWNVSALGRIGQYVARELPRDCAGSPQAVEAWPKTVERRMLLHGTT